LEERVAFLENLYISRGSEGRQLLDPILPAPEGGGRLDFANEVIYAGGDHPEEQDKDPDSLDGDAPLSDSGGSDKVLLDAADPEDSAVNDLSTIIWRLNLDHDGFTGPSSNLCVPGNDTARHERRNGIDGPPKSPLETSGLESPTSSEVLFDLQVWKYSSALFLDVVNPAFQFFETGEQLEAIITGCPSRHTETLLRCAVVVAGALYSDHRRPEVEQVVREAVATTERLSLFCSRSTPSEHLVTAFSILALRELSLQNANMGWMFNSMAGAMVNHLALHATDLEVLGDASEPRHKAPAATSSNRSRAFWSFFLVDRIATTVLGRNCTVPWRRLRVAYPTTGRPRPNAQPDVDALAFNHQCRLWDIHDRFMDQM
jgi:hypothetical protein